MDMAKQCIYLSDITLHTRGFRPTLKFSNVAEKGRMYSSLPKGYEKDVDTQKGTFGISIDLPQDLKERMNHGEVELMIPKDGLSVYAGRDVYEFIEKMDHAKHRQLIHRTWGEKAWRDKQKGV
jgi:hypothetical protein